MPFSDAELLERERLALRSLYGAVHSPGGRVIELDGVRAALTPACRERSVANGVVYDDAASLRRALPKLAEEYAEAGCAWTVWVRPGDTEAAAACEEAGHRLDADPEAMGMDLGDLAPPPDDGLDWFWNGDIETLGRINDLAYSYGDDSMSRAIGTPPPGTFPIYVARHQGEPAAVLGLVESHGNAEVIWVATDPRAAGNRLAGRLLHRALADSRERGCETTTLEATKRGEPAYAALGYRRLGSLQMWEKRPA